MPFFTDEEKSLLKKRSAIGKLKFIVGTAKRKCFLFLFKNIPFFKPAYDTQHHENPITIKHLLYRNILRRNRNIYWPVHPSTVINGVQNIYAGIDTSPGYSNGCYIQAIGKVYIGDYSQIAPNVGIVSSNHSLLDTRHHDIGEVNIGKYCWIGMNSVILPNVTLGDFTIVKAGSVVSKSFPQGYCVIGGNPAVLLKQFPEASHHLFTRYNYEIEYNGFIRSDKFETYRKKHLKV